MPFDYENARRDIADSGADPDYLDTLNPEKRDAYLRKLGMKPERYGGGSKDPYYKKEERETHYDDHNDDGCFLTSACVKAKGLPDDCEELQILRKYRDGWLRSTNNGEQEIRDYYRIAPEIVNAINERPDAQNVWETVYRDLVLPCVELIKADQYEKAFDTYKGYTVSLAKQVT